MIAGALATGVLLAGALAAQQPANDPPRFEVPAPEQQREVAALERLFALHAPQCSPKATLWDAWLPEPALWPASPSNEAMRAAWKAALRGRRIDASGYVETHQHASIAHPGGWPFPFWNQGAGGFGWHFSFVDTVGPPWRKNSLDPADALAITGAENMGLHAPGLRLRTTDARVTIQLPLPAIDTLQAPFLQLRCSTGGHPLTCTVRWVTESGAARACEFEVGESEAVAPHVFALHGEAGWQGRVRDVCLEIAGAPLATTLTLRALFSQYDTRHNVNSQAFIDGVLSYANWSGDRAFLIEQLPRIDAALRHLFDEHGVREHGLVRTTWVGHDGRPGFRRDDAGTKTLHPGRGIGNNYWDLLPFGHDDCYATLRLIGTLRRLLHALDELAIPGSGLPTAERGALDRDRLETTRRALIQAGRDRFWNPQTDRFVACVDADGNAHDYGFTFVNLEAIVEGLAAPEQATAILDWLSGARTVAGDTATGTDIYHFRFAPRSTTLRNVAWYGWYWHGPESIPWGGQVQDGGAVLGFSYHDILARLRVRGPDDAWARLRAIARWFRDVESAGGYRPYYAADLARGTLQGGGTAGGLGMDHEFFESALVPCALLRGFLGVRASLSHLEVAPQLPSDWPALTIRGIRFQQWTLDITATRDEVQIARRQGPAAGLRIAVGAGGKPIAVPATLDSVTLPLPSTGTGHDR